MEHKEPCMLNFWLNISHMAIAATVFCLMYIGFQPYVKRVTLLLTAVGNDDIECILFKVF